MNLYGMTHPRVHLVPAPACLPACLAPHPHPHPHPSAAGASGFDIAAGPPWRRVRYPAGPGIDILVPIEYSILNIQ